MDGLRADLVEALQLQDEVECEVLLGDVQA
jgi:hypothetical protein